MTTKYQPLQGFASSVTLNNSGGAITTLTLTPVILLLKCLEDTLDDCDATTATTPHTAFASKTGRSAAAIKELEEMSHVKNLGLRGRNCAFGGGGVCCTFRKPKKVPDVNFRALMSRFLNVYKFSI